MSASSWSSSMSSSMSDSILSTGVPAPPPSSLVLAPLRSSAVLNSAVDDFQFVRKVGVFLPGQCLLRIFRKYSASLRFQLIFFSATSCLNLALSGGPHLVALLPADDRMDYGTIAQGL